MPKRWFKSILPSPEKIKNNKNLKILGNLVHDPNLWHLNRHSVANAFFIGLFCAFIPLPAQMLIAAVFAIFTHSNLPLSVALVWISNPITMPPIFYFSYRVGVYILGIPDQEFSFELSTTWLATQLQAIWQPFLVGCLICGLVSGTICYIAIKLLWRWHVVKAWQNRKSQPQSPH